MKILVTGANGYIGMRLLMPLLEAGHEVVALMRRPKEFLLPAHDLARLTVIEGDLLKPDTLGGIPADIEAAYYLVHSMSDSRSFAGLEEECARNFVQMVKKTKARQIIYLSGISSDSHLSVHLASRRAVEGRIKQAGIPYTILRAGVIIGSGSASFEIIRDLAEKLPFMVAPRWVQNRTEPIAVADVLFYLQAVLGLTEALNQTFEIGSGDVLTYEEMLKGYARIRRLHRFIARVPCLTPRLSSYWLYLVTSTNFSLASSLVDSLQNETICTDLRIRTLLPHKCLSYEEAVRRALSNIEQNHVISSWRDALSVSELNPNLQEYITVPTSGCLTDFQRLPIRKESRERVLGKIWAIGGETGWYYGNFLWNLRGFIDKVCGGTGLNRGRTHLDHLETGDAIDFWRVLVADREHGRLLLYAEMKLPGEAWLEFTVTPRGENYELEQKATFRPRGVAGRLYWYLLFPVHWLIFRGMAKEISK